MIKSKKCDYKIGLTEATLTHLTVVNIAPPTTAQYKSFSSTQGQSDGGAIQEGYKLVEFTWVNMSAPSLYRLKGFVESALSDSKLLYMTIPLNSGQTINSRKFYNVVGKPHPMLIREQGNMTGKGMIYQAISLKLNDVTILGEA